MGSYTGLVHIEGVADTVAVVVVVASVVHNSSVHWDAAVVGNCYTWSDWNKTLKVGAGFVDGIASAACVVVVAVAFLVVVLVAFLPEVVVAFLVVVPVAFLLEVVAAFLVVVALVVDWHHIDQSLVVVDVALAFVAEAEYSVVLTQAALVVARCFEALVK